MPFYGPHKQETKQRISITMKRHAKKYPNWNKANKPRIRVSLGPSRALSYVLGVLNGDGYLTYNPRTYQYFICLGSISKEFALSFSSNLKCIGLHPCKIYIDSRKVYHVVALSKQFYEFYKILNFVQLRTLIKGYELDFIRGMYESEGSIFWNSRTQHFDLDASSNRNLEILNLMSGYLNSIGVRNSVYKRGVTINGYKMFKIRVYQDGIKNFLNSVNPCIKFLSDNKIIKDY